MSITSLRRLGAFVFAVMVAAEIVLLYTSIKPRAVIIITVMALAAGIKFSAWYPSQR